MRLWKRSVKRRCAKKLRKRSLTHIAQTVAASLPAVMKRERESVVPADVARSPRQLQHASRRVKPEKRVKQLKVMQKEQQMMLPANRQRVKFPTLSEGYAPPGR